MTYYKPISRWTRKRRTESELSRVMHELHQCDAEFFETNKVLNTINTEIAGDCVDTSLSATEAGPCCFHSDSDADISQESNVFPRFQKHTSAESDSESSADDCCLSDELADWAIRYNVSHVAVTALLGILRKVHPDLPKDSRTILNRDNVASAVAVRNIDGGSYYHFGLENSLISVINECGMDNSEALKLHINVDGLPLHRSTNAQFWPILGLVTNCKNCEPFVIGLFYGNCKPVDIAEYMNEFVSECQILCTTGIKCNNTTYAISLTAVICDTPARAFVKKVKGHAGYFGCDKCKQEGEYVEGRMTFPETSAELRTDHSFRTMSNDDHHLGHSPLSKLPIDMISAFPLDYMHLICLGVMRKLLHLWIKGPLAIRLGRQAIDRLSEALVAFREQVPFEFSRKPRSLAYLERWKATELRQFLLYTGMISLHGVVDDVLYNNFMLLSVSMYILLSPRFCRDYSDYAGELLLTFVENFGNIYGKHNLSYNVHATVHLANEAKIHGPLDNISAFVFENYLGRLKKLIRKPHAPLQQAVRRLSERCVTVKPIPVNLLQKEHSLGPVPSQFTFCQQYREYHQHDCKITLSSKDNCVLIGSSVALVRNFLQVNSDRFVVFQNFMHMESCYDYPVDSTKLEVYKVADLDELNVAPLNSIRRKCVVLSWAGQTFAIPFVH